jgi:hypothetical protein
LGFGIDALRASAFVASLFFYGGCASCFAIHCFFLFLAVRSCREAKTFCTRKKFYQKGGVFHGLCAQTGAKKAANYGSL